MSWVSICTTASWSTVPAARSTSISRQFRKQGTAIKRQGAALYSKIGQALLEGQGKAAANPTPPIEAVIPLDEFTEERQRAVVLAGGGSDHSAPGWREPCHPAPLLRSALLAGAGTAAPPRLRKAVLAAGQTLREMNADNLAQGAGRCVPPPSSSRRWRPLSDLTPKGLDRRFYEICALSELKNALRSGDIWGQGLRQFRDFDELPAAAERFARLKACAGSCPWRSTRTGKPVPGKSACSCDEQRPPSPAWPRDHELPDLPSSTESGLKINPTGFSRWAPNTAQALIDQTSSCCRASSHRTADGRGRLTGSAATFTHLKDGAEAKETDIAAVSVLGRCDQPRADQEAESSPPDLRQAVLLQAWHIPRRPTRPALSRAGQPRQYRQYLAASLGRRHLPLLPMGQRFRAGGRGRKQPGHVKPEDGKRGRGG